MIEKQIRCPNCGKEITIKIHTEFCLDGNSFSAVCPHCNASVHGFYSFKRGEASIHHYYVKNKNGILKKHYTKEVRKERFKNKIKDFFRCLFHKHKPAATLDLVKNSYPHSIAHELFDVVPMKESSSNVMCMKPVYGTEKWHPVDYSNMKVHSYIWNGFPKDVENPHKWFCENFKEKGLGYIGETFCAETCDKCGLDVMMNHLEYKDQRICPGSKLIFNEEGELVDIVKL